MRLSSVAENHQMQRDLSSRLDPTVCPILYFQHDDRPVATLIDQVICVVVEYHKIADNNDTASMALGQCRPRCTIQSWHSAFRCRRDRLACQRGGSAKVDATPCSKPEKAAFGTYAVLIEHPEAPSRQCYVLEGDTPNQKSCFWGFLAAPLQGQSV